MAHHIDAVRYPHGDRKLLFDQQDRDAAPGDFGDQVADLLNNHRCQPFGGLVDHHEFGIAHQCAANCQHLLLAARENTCGGIGARRKIRKHLQHALKPPFARNPCTLDAKYQVLPHRQPGKDIPIFGNVPESQLRDPITRQSGDINALELYRTARWNLSHNGFDCRGSPHTIASQKADDFSSIDRHIDTLQDMALAVVGMQIPYLQHQTTSVPR